MFFTNHESFRKVFLRNHLVNMKGLTSFTEKRHQQRALLTSKGCLTWADYRLVKHEDTLRANENKFRQVRYYVESVRVKIVNKFDSWVYGVNKWLFKFMEGRSVIAPQCLLVFGVVVVVPIIFGRRRTPGEGEYSDRISDLISTKVSRWKVKLLGRRF